MREKSFRLEIFLVSLAAILLEISFTRIFSFKLYYYFTYLILGIALLGLGAGGVFVAIFAWLRRIPPGRLVPACSLAASVLVPVAYLVIALVQINTIDLVDRPTEIFKLALICAVLFAPFLMVGVVLATVFGARPHDMNRLYFADLVGAGLGCALCVPLFATLSPPGCVALSGLVLAGAALASAVRTRTAGFRLAIPVSLALAALVAHPAWLPDPVADRTKTASPQRRGERPLLFSEWSSVFRVDVMASGMGDDMYMLIHDGTAGSAVRRYDGDLSSLESFATDIRSKPFGVIGPDPRVLIIGSAGGHEILASLYFGADSITAVELNPVTVSLLQNQLAEYSGRIAHNDRVRLVNAEGRSFLERSHDRYDLIWFVAPDTYAAMNAASSGAFVLSESYLYTAEMIVEALGHLTEGGVVCAQFGELDFANRPNRTARYLATARAALREMGVEDFARHILVSTGPGLRPSSTILLAREPFSAEQIRRYRETVAGVPRTRVWHPPGPADPGGVTHPVEAVLRLSDRDLQAWYREYPFEVDAITDDSPFFWHFTRFRDAFVQPWRLTPNLPDWEHATGERTLLILVGFAAVFALVLVLLPLVAVRDVWKRIPCKKQAGVYFAALGLGFMFFEVSLIQKLTLFLGYPTYSLTVTLFSLLVFSGVGSLLSARYAQRRNRALAALLGVLALLTLFYQFGLGHLVDGFVGGPLALRAAVATLLLAPLGLCLGAFMPIGVTTLASLTTHQQEYVAWGWAVNGFFSVVSSVLATILSMSFGFRFVLLLAAAVYAVGVLAFTRIPQPSARSRPGEPVW